MRRTGGFAEVVCLTVVRLRDVGPEMEPRDAHRYDKSKPRRKNTVTITKTRNAQVNIHIVTVSGADVCSSCFPKESSPMLPTVGFG